MVYSFSLFVSSIAWNNVLLLGSFVNAIYLIPLQAYASVLKANMDNLKKRDRKTEKSKAKKSKATQ